MYRTPVTRPLVLLCTDAADVYARAAERAGLAERVELACFKTGEMPEPALLARAEAALAWRIPRGAFAAAPRLRWVQTLTAGVEGWLARTDLPAALTLTCARGTHRVQMPENILGALFHLTKPFAAAERDQEARRWTRRVSEPLAGKTLGILGLGAIGQEVARKAAALELTVIGARRDPAPVPHVTRVFPPEGIGEILGASDFVLLLLPVTPATLDLMDARRLAEMRPTAWLLNYGRGELVVDADLVDAVKRHAIARRGPRRLPDRAPARRPPVLDDARHHRAAALRRAPPHPRRASRGALRRQSPPVPRRRAAPSRRRPRPRLLGGLSGGGPRERPVDPVERGLRARRESRRGARPGAARSRRLAGGHRRLLEPSGARIVPRPDRPRRRGTRPHRGPRGARRAGTLRRGSVRLPGRGGDGRGGRGCGGARCERRNPGALYCCDPVIGEVGRGVYVRAGIAEEFRDRLVPLADIVTPNPFELELLTGIAPATLPAARAAARALVGRGPGLVVATGLQLSEAPGQLAVLAATRDEAWLVRHSRRVVRVWGTGDAFAALFLGSLPRPPRCAGRAGARRRRAGRGTRRRGGDGADELPLVSAQDVARPSTGSLPRGGRRVIRD